MRGKNDWVFCAFGSKGQKMNLVVVSLKTFNNCTKHYRLVYGQCDISTDFAMRDQKREFAEYEIESYCLLLPHVHKDQNFEKNCINLQ